jgi:hypothetical protein
VEFAKHRTFDQFPSDGMLTTATTEQQNFHAHKATSS